VARGPPELRPLCSNGLLVASQLAQREPNKE
jgi:hypothetical protein